MFTRRPPALEARPFPLVLRHEWRCDLPNPRLGRPRALERTKSKVAQTARPEIKRAG
jgi:hypothetical protein